MGLTFGISVIYTGGAGAGGGGDKKKKKAKRRSERGVAAALALTGRFSPIKENHAGEEPPEVGRKR